MVVHRSPASETVSTMVVLPPIPVLGVIVTVRAPPEPLKTIFEVGTSVVLLDAPVTVTNAAVVTSSLTVKGSASVDEFILMY